VLSPEAFAEKNCPQVLQALAPADFSQLENFRKQVNLYDRAVKMHLLK